ncbi:hypothetical protein HMPREF0379_2013 [[Eubacterium] yurii subsp. margaretiae ATCC 43715]|nr:hypothetical protein HMPREF0379_2013 [[Eubacterium] yurii subsp. margaretiae ATCC 43715]
MMTWFTMLIIPPFERIIDLEKVEEISLNKLNNNIDDEEIKFIFCNDLSDEDMANQNFFEDTIKQLRVFQKKRRYIGALKIKDDVVAIVSYIDSEDDCEDLYDEL